MRSMQPLSVAIAWFDAAVFIYFVICMCVYFMTLLIFHFMCYPVGLDINKNRNTNCMSFIN